MKKIIIVVIVAILFSCNKEKEREREYKYVETVEQIFPRTEILTKPPKLIKAINDSIAYEKALSTFQISLNLLYMV